MGAWNIPTERPPFVEYGHCWCGCGGKTKIAPYNDRWKGRVRGEPLRFLPRHQTTHPAPVDYIEDPETGCWNWQRTKSNGYGIMHSKPIVYAHRTYYERAHGPIPNGLQIDHLCRNPACVNPAHLEAVTQGENLRRAPTVKLTWEDARAIRTLGKQGILHRTIAAQFGVSVHHVHSIMANKVWRE